MTELNKKVARPVNSTHFYGFQNKNTEDHRMVKKENSELKIQRFHQTNQVLISMASTLH